VTAFDYNALMHALWENGRMRADKRLGRASADPSGPLENLSDGSPFFAFACVLGLAFGIAGWVVASTVSGILVPVCSGSSLLLGALGTRSRFRALGFAGVVMGLLLLPAAIRIVRQLVGA
jgi:hypothetical protein